MSSAPILSPDFKWIPAATHSTSEAFKARQVKRGMIVRDSSVRIPPVVRKLELARVAGIVKK